MCGIQEKPCQGIWIGESPVYGLRPWEGGQLLGKDMRREEGPRIVLGSINT